jgi:glutaredoxin
MTSLFTRVKNRLRGRRRLDHLAVTVYTRQQCCCCHKAIDLLQDEQKRYGFPIETVDIDEDPTLVEAHGLTVPVVEINGKIRFRGQVNPVLLRRLLDAEAASLPEKP